MNNKVDKWAERRILDLILNQGLTQKVVGERLGISPRTVRIYLKKYRDSQNNVSSSSSTEQAEQAS